MILTLILLRLVRLVTSLTVCNCLRLVVRLVVRLVRLVNRQVFENIALGNSHFAALRALVVNYYPGGPPSGRPRRVTVNGAAHAVSRYRERTA